MADQPEALRLADAIDPLTRQSLDNLTCSVAAVELRRLADIERRFCELQRHGVSRSAYQKAEAERDALRETERKFGTMMHAVMAERDALAEANEAFGKRQVWWDNKMLALEAERDALLEVLDRYRGQLDRFGVHSAADAIAIALVEKGGGNG